MKKVMTITQTGRNLRTDNYLAGYVSSGNNIAEIKFLDDFFEGYIIGITCAINETTIIELVYNPETHIVTFPYILFKEKGYKYIALYGIRGDETVSTELLEIFVEGSNSLDTKNEPYPPNWKILATSLWEEYYKTYIEPIHDEIKNLVIETKDCKDKINNALSKVEAATDRANEGGDYAVTSGLNAEDAANKANIAATNANNATTSANSAANSVVIIRNGTTTPASSLGKSGDFYVNTANGDFYLKNSTTWNKKFNMIALDQITELKNAFNSVTSLTKQLFLLMHPVGCIYMSTSSVSPQTTFGGTWVRWGNGRVPVGVDTSDSSFNTVEKTGGEKQHTLTINEIPNHVHGQVVTSTSSSGAGIRTDYNADGSSAPYPQGVNTQGTGGNQSHNNLQPYITCYMWKRTA